MPRPLFAALALALSFAGCGAEPTPNYGYTTETPMSLGPGKLLIAWEVAGQQPLDCSGVDHLTLAIAYASGETVTIQPIPCALTRFRYDNLPEGGAVLDLAALDASGCRVTEGTAPDQVTPTLPDAPSPLITLPPPRACR